MKRIIAGFLMIALSAGAVQAQGHQGKNHQKGKQDKAQHEMPYKKLDLTADQQNRIKTINENFRNQMKSLKDQTGLSEAEKRSRRESLQKQHVADIQAVLTAEQRAKAENMKKDWKQDKKEYKRDSMNHHRGDRGMHQGKKGDFAKDLNLTAEQKAKLEAIRAENKTKLEALRADNSLTKEQKRAKMQELMKAQQEQMKAILTPEQLEKMKTTRKGRSPKSRK